MWDYGPGTHIFSETPSKELSLSLSSIIMTMSLFAIAGTAVNFPKPLLPIHKFTARKSRVCFKKTCVTRPSVGSRNYELKSHNDGKQPFWLGPSIRALKSVFLSEQPSQLKYIEWPGFQNTLKTATLTLVLVAILIVVLSSVDSGLWYLLASILRKPA